jgi:hypothetical protein
MCIVEPILRCFGFEIDEILKMNIDYFCYEYEERKESFINLHKYNMIGSVMIK